MGDGYAPCHIAISNGDLDCLVVCLRAGADSEVRNFRGETPQQAAYLASGKNGKCPMVSPRLFFFLFFSFLFRIVRLFNLCRARDPHSFFPRFRCWRVKSTERRRTSWTTPKPSRLSRTVTRDRLAKRTEEGIVAYRP